MAWLLTLLLWVTSVPVAKIHPSAPRGETTVRIWVARDPGMVCTDYEDEFKRVSHRVGGSSQEELIAAALEEVLEQDWASAAGMVEEIRLEDGLATVLFGDLPSVIPSASTSCGTYVFHTEVLTTIFEFEGVDRVRLTLEGDCHAFGVWMQSERCSTFRHPPGQPEVVP